jgi:hypothetical protein
MIFDNGEKTTTVGQYSKPKVVETPQIWFYLNIRKLGRILGEPNGIRYKFQEYLAELLQIGKTLELSFFLVTWFPVALPAINMRSASTSTQISPRDEQWKLRTAKQN